MPAKKQDIRELYRVRRRDASTTISLRLDTEMLRDLDIAKYAFRRNRSSMVQKILSNTLPDIIAALTPAERKEAEESVKRDHDKMEKVRKKA